MYVRLMKDGPPYSTRAEGPAVVPRDLLSGLRVNGPAQP